ncbi:uncharacterized protein LOC132277916 [Cornus florida]|uniref:uncharacterized protein LOC132277916 n=1 Tax=Cornus florida TaxID=4283 RepID=UPI00289B96A6|nr:uncharacterized protein LOC132277916 [Cornus florida]
MSTSMILCENLVFSNRSSCHKSLLYSHNLFNIVVQLSRGRKRFGGLIPYAKKSHSRKRSWWKKFFFDEDGNWLGLRDEDMLEVEEEAPDSSGEDELSEGEKFEVWKRRAEAIIELTEAQEDMSNEENRRWEDWLVDRTKDVNGSSWVQDSSDELGKSREGVQPGPSDMIPERGLVESVRDLVLGREDDDMLYEDRVVRYASLNSAKFLALLVIIPWALDLLVHDYVLMPFLDRYVKTVPLAAEMLDVIKQQKLEMVKELKLEMVKELKLEVEIGKSPPLSDEEFWLELQHKAIELRDEWRLENRREFANIWSDMVFGISLFILLYFNQSKEKTESGACSFKKEDWDKSYNALIKSLRDDVAKAAEDLEAEEIEAAVDPAADDVVVDPAAIHVDIDLKQPKEDLE